MCWPGPEKAFFATPYKYSIYHVERWSFEMLCVSQLFMFYLRYGAEKAL